MHRAYQPLTPANNIFLKRRWDQDYFETHRKKVLAAKAMIDNKPPKTYMHLHIKLKKLQMEGERLAIVERNNRILLEKMAHIMRTSGSVTNKKTDYVQKSLNKTKRQRELLRITHENLAILKRITSKEPTYSHLRWEQEWHANQEYMMNISKFPHYWRTAQHSYMARKEQQAAANKRIRDLVIECNSPDRYSNNRNSDSPNSIGNRGRNNYRENTNNSSTERSPNPNIEHDKNVRLHKLGSSVPTDKDLFS